MKSFFLPNPPLSRKLPTELPLPKYQQQSQVSVSLRAGGSQTAWLGGQSPRDCCGQMSVGDGVTSGLRFGYAAEVHQVQEISVSKSWNLPNKICHVSKL